MSTSPNIFALRALLVLMLCASSFLGFTQTEKYYFNKHWIHCDEASAKYYRIIEEVDTLLKVTDYYLSGNVQFEGFLENKGKNRDVLKIRGDFEQKTVGTCTYYRKNGEKEYSMNMRPFHPIHGLDSMYLKQLDSLDTIGIDLSKLEFQINYYKTSVESGFILENDEIPHGNWVDRDLTTGTILSKAHYKKGKQDGIQVVFYKSGILKELAYFKNGEFHGEHRMYNRKGVLKKGKVYENGVLKETWYYKKPKKKK